MSTTFGVGGPNRERMVPPVAVPLMVERARTMSSRWVVADLRTLTAPGGH